MQLPPQHVLYKNNNTPTAVKSAYMPLGRALAYGGSASLAGVIGRNHDLLRTKYGAAIAFQIVSPVYRAVTLRADVVGRTPWQILRGDEVIARSTDSRPEHPFAQAILNSRQHYSEGLFYLWQMSLSLFGESFFEVAKNRHSYLDVSKGIKWLNPLGMTILDATGRIEGFQYSANNATVRYATDELVFDRYINPLDDHRGHSPTFAAMAKSNVEQNVWRFFNAHFTNNAVPGGIVQPPDISGTTNNTWDNTTVSRVSSELRNRTKGADNAGALVISPIKMQLDLFDPIDIAKQIPVDEQAAKAIYTTYGIPRSAAGDSESSAYQSNNKAVAQMLYETVIEPETTNIQEVVNRELLPQFTDSDDERFEFDLSEYVVVSETDKARAETVDIQVRGGTMSLYDAQQEMGREGDERLKDIYIIDSIPVHVDDFRAIYEKKYTTAPTVAFNQSTPAPPERPKNDTPDIPTPPTEEAKGNVDAQALLDTSTKSQRRELGIWQKKILANGMKAAWSFNPNATAGDVADYVLSELESGMEEDAIKAVFDEAFRRVELKALTDTRTQYIAAFDSLVQRARDNSPSRSTFVGQFDSMNLRYVNQAAIDALQDVGAGNELSAAEELAVTRIFNQSKKFVRNFADQLLEAGLSETQTDIRGDMWWNKSILPVYYEVVNISGENPMMEFAGRDGDESCITCRTLKGQRHRLLEWQRRDLVPQVNTENYECGGWRCQHGLKPVRTNEERGNWLDDPPDKWRNAA